MSQLVPKGKKKKKRRGEILNNSRKAGGKDESLARAALKIHKHS